jgi:DNA-binding MarR family transcriptional regulator
MSGRKSLGKKALGDADYRALSEFRYHIRCYLEFSDQAARTSSIEPKQYQLLLVIRGLPRNVEPTVGVLAQQLRLRHNSVVELINRAEANGLVKRSRSGTRVFVRLSRRGARVLERAVEERLKELRVAGPALAKALQQLTKSAGARVKDLKTRDKA